MSEDMILGLIFVGVGFLFIGLALFFLIRTRIFINNSEKTQGTITLMLYEGDSEGSGYIPIFEFRTLQGKKVEVTSDLRTNPPQFKVGQIVEVLYDPENPEGARINKGFNLYFVPAFLGLFGLAFGGMGVIFFFK
jgi:hypothetical protein